MKKFTIPASIKDCSKIGEDQVVIFINGFTII